MIIPSSLDMSQFYVDGQFTKDSEMKLKDYADSYFAGIKDNKARINVSICSIKGRINERLQERRGKAYEAIATIVGMPEYEEAKAYDTELLYFLCAVRIYQMEQGRKEATIFDEIEYVDDFLKIYYQMIFYFRRIHLKMSKPVMMECMTYIRTMKLSVFAVVEILMDCNVGGKEMIASTLADFYLDQGSPKEALFLVNMALSNSREDCVGFLTAKRDSIKEMIG